jgi:hypothetical protein
LEVLILAAYELFEKVYFHRMGQFMAHLWTANKDCISPKEYIRQSFDEDMTDCCVECATPTGLILTYDNPANKKLCNAERLQGIEVKAGYWLCRYDGHTGDWMLMWYESRYEAKAEYKRLYMRYFRHQVWFWIVKI